MKTFRVILMVAVSLLIILGLVGCKSTPPVDWAARVGNYTYDQAVTELGPPDKTAKLTDGQTMAEWITGQKQNSSVSIGTGIFGGGGGGGVGVGVGQTVGGGYQARVLRLTFGPDNRLVAWSKN